MTTPSFFEQTGLIIMANQSLFQQKGGYPVPIHEKVASYSHRINTQEGFSEATIGMNASRALIEDWFERGVGRDIEVSDPSSSIVFNGFVNSVEIVAGGTKQSRGPLVSLANRVLVVYSTVDTSTTPPTVGVRMRTAYAQDGVSQRQYGVLTKIVSLGGCTDTEATRFRDAYLKTSKYPKVAITFTSQSAPPSISLRVKGYYHYLKLNPYNSALTGLQNLSTKLTSIITGDPNSILSVGAISSNTFQVPAFEDEYRLEEALIRSLVGLGDASDNRYTFGVYEGRKVYYQQAPSIRFPKYTYSITDHQVLSAVGGTPIKPWLLRPGEWITSKDWFSGRTTPVDGASGASTELEQDPSIQFIEEVTYSSPWGWSMSGSQGDKLEQMLAKLQLRGR